MKIAGNIAGHLPILPVGAGTTVVVFFGQYPLALQRQPHGVHVSEDGSERKAEKPGKMLHLIFF